MSVPLLSVTVAREHDVVGGRQRARQLAALLGFDSQDQTRIATAVSKIARNAVGYGGGGRIEFSVDGQMRPQVFTIRVWDRGPGIADLDTILSGRYHSSTGMVDLTGLHVLLVEDELDTLELFATALEHWGASVTKASDAAVAIQAFEDARPDVLVSDIGMPGIDGYDLIRQIRARPPERGGGVPAIALTAYAMNTDSGRIAAAGYQRHVTKPLDPLILARAIAAVASPTI